MDRLDMVVCWMSFDLSELKRCLKVLKDELIRDDFEDID